VVRYYPEGIEQTMKSKKEKVCLKQPVFVPLKEGKRNYDLDETGNLVLAKQGKIMFTCSACQKQCLGYPITQVDMSFDVLDSNYGAAEWNDGKKYCGAECMLTALRESVFLIFDEIENGDR